MIEERKCLASIKLMSLPTCIKYDGVKKAFKIEPPITLIFPNNRLLLFKDNETELALFFEKTTVSFTKNNLEYVIKNGEIVIVPTKLIKGIKKPKTFQEAKQILPRIIEVIEKDLNDFFKFMVQVAFYKPGGGRNVGTKLSAK